MNTHDIELRSAVMGAITDVWDRAKQIDDTADEVLDLIEADRQRRMPSDEEIIASVVAYGEACASLNTATEREMRLHDIRASLSRYSSGQPAHTPCDAGEICIDCQPRRPDGSCPDGPAASPAGSPADSIGFCSFDPDDRFYHAADRTWWRRDNDGMLVRAEAPAASAEPIGYVTPAAIDLLRDGKMITLCPTDVDNGVPVFLEPQPVAPVARGPNMTDDQIIAIARDLGWHTQIDEIRDNAVELARAVIEAYQRQQWISVDDRPPAPEES